MHYKKLSWLSFLVVFGIVATTTSVSAQTNQSDTSGIQTFSSPTVSIDSINGNGVPQSTQYNPTTGEISGGGIIDPIQFGSAGSSASGSGFGNNNPNTTGSASNSSQGSSNGESTAATGNSTDNPTDSDNGSSVASVECSTKSCLEANGNEPSKVSLNDVAALLDEGLDTSLDTLAAIQRESQETPIATAANNEGPRRIARRNSNSSHACGCANPASSITNNSPRRIVRKPDSGYGCGCVNTVEARKIKYREVQARKIVEQRLSESKKFIEQVNQIEPEKNIW